MPEQIKPIQIGDLIARNIKGDDKTRNYYVNEDLDSILMAATPWIARPFAILLRSRVADRYKQGVKEAKTTTDLLVVHDENRPQSWFLRFFRPRYRGVISELKKRGIFIDRFGIRFL